MLNLRTLAVLSLIPLAACSGTASDNGDDGGGNGGSPMGGTAGASGTGQGGAQGGTAPTGGSPALGGTGPMGGTAPSGGVAGTAGTPATGGTAGAATTGGTGGAGPTGGVSGTAGSPAGTGGGGTGAGTGGAGAAGKGGSGGSAGMAVMCPAAPADTIIGWATQGGTTTGGGTGAAQAATASNLNSMLSGTTARVVEITGTISLASVQIGSNKTLQGRAGSPATINGGIQLDGSSNVIIKNLRVNASNSGVGDDGIQIQGSDHVWIDHVEVYDAADGNMDITDGSDYITVSWSKFRYSGQGDHNFSNLIASSDSDTGSYRITFHHNWWANNVNERMPRVRFGQVHVFNNLYGIGTGAASNDHCIRAAYRANVRAESNYFDIVQTPHEIAEDSSNMAVLTATTCANNTSAGSPAGCNIEYLSLNTGGNPASRGTAFTPPYQFASSQTVADCVKAHVSNATTGAGPH